MANILALLGSPRRGGNTEVLLSAFVKGVEEGGGQVSTLRVSDMSIKPCVNCDGCAETGECVIDDDMGLIYDKLAAADGLIMASPIYFGGVSGYIKAAIDRFQVYWFINFGNENLKHLKAKTKRPAFFLAVGGMKNKKYCEAVKTTAEALFLNTRLSFRGFLCLQGYDEKGSLEKDPDVLKNAFDQGLEFAKNFEGAP
jgi:multimeric flavodoxin WrbA